MGLEVRKLLFDSFDLPGEFLLTPSVGGFRLQAELADLLISGPCSLLGSGELEEARVQFLFPSFQGVDNLTAVYLGLPQEFGLGLLSGEMGILSVDSFPQAGKFRSGEFDLLLCLCQLPPVFSKEGERLGELLADLGKLGLRFQ